MKTDWQNWNTGEKAKLHRLENGKVWAVFTNRQGFGTDDKEFFSVQEAKEFFTKATGWH